MEQTDVSVFLMDCYAIIVVYAIGEYLSTKYVMGTLDVYDPYFFLIFLYLDYLKERFRYDRSTFLKMIIG